MCLECFHYTFIVEKNHTEPVSEINVFEQNLSIAFRLDGTTGLLGVM